MKKLFIVLVLFSANLFGQSNKFFDSPFGLGIGYTPAWYVPDMNVLNSELKNFGAGELTSSGFYASGFGGFIYLPFINPHLRFGGITFGGSTASSNFVNGINKEVIYTLNGGGLTIEYSLPFVRNVGISVGAILGAGSIQIDIYKNSGSFDWGTALAELNTFSPDVNRTFKNSYFLISPTLNIDIPVYRFTAVRIGAGYQFTIGGEWKADNLAEVKNVPSEINGQSFFIQTGIFIGFFSF